MRVSRALQPRDGRYEQWVLTSAYEQELWWQVGLAFAKAHPGPVGATRDWVSFSSPHDLALFMSEPDLGAASKCSKPVPAVHGGVACASDAHLVLQGTPEQKARQSETPGATGEAFGFTWTIGLTLVRVGVSGWGLTLDEARKIALLARTR